MSFSISDLNLKLKLNRIHFVIGYLETVIKDIRISSSLRVVGYCVPNIIKSNKMGV